MELKGVSTIRDCFIATKKCHTLERHCRVFCVYLLRNDDNDDDVAVFGHSKVTNVKPSVSSFPLFLRDPVTVEKRFKNN